MDEAWKRPKNGIKFWFEILTGGDPYTCMWTEENIEMDPKLKELKDQDWICLGKNLEQLLFYRDSKFLRFLNAEGN